MSKKAKKNLARLGIAQELLKRKQPPKISAPDMLEGIESKNKALFSYGIQRGKMFPMPGGSIQKAVKEKSKKDVRVKAKAGIFVTCPSKREIKNKKTRLT